MAKLRFFPKRVELVHDTSDTAIWTARIAPDEFHSYRVIRDGDKATVYVDGPTRFGDPSSRRKHQGDALYTRQRDECLQAGLR